MHSPTPSSNDEFLPSTGDPSPEGGPLFELCAELGDRFVAACLVEDDPYLVREWMEKGIANDFELSPERAGKLFDLALEVLHLRTHGRYFGSVAEVGYLISSASGGLTEPGIN